MIRMNDFQSDPSVLRERQIGAITRVLDSGWYVLGPNVEEFERQFAKICGVEFAMGVGNGMDAIEIGLRCLGIGAGDEVITTPMTAFATVLAILRAGANPVLADIDPESALLDMDSVKRCIGTRTRAVVLVHLYGQVRRMEEWVELCRAAGIALVEDCAQSHMAAWQGRAAGSFGQCGAFSFYPTKNLGTAGDGGALVTGSQAIAEQARSMRNYGQSRRYYHPHRGLNSRLDEIHAALLLERLQWLEQFTERRRAIAARYTAGIRNSAVSLLAPPISPENHVHHLFVLKCARRAELTEHLRLRGVESFAHYPVAVHHQESANGLKCDPHGLQYAERHAQVCVSIPCHHNLSNQQVDIVVGAVNCFN